MLLKLIPTTATALKSVGNTIVVLFGPLNLTFRLGVALGEPRPSIVI